MMIQLQQELEEKDEALERLQTTFQENQELEPLSIATIESNTITGIPLVISPSIDNSQENLGEFENHTKGIGYKLLR
jgi:hypothetical protein